MSGETEQEVSGWTVDTLHALLRIEIERARFYAETRIAEAERVAEIRIGAVEKAAEEAHKTAEKAVLKAESSADKRFESVNEFRAQLSDQAASFMPRAEAVALIGSLSEKLASHEARTREAQSELSDRMTRREGSSEGATLTRASLLAWLGGAVAFVTLIVIVSTFLAAGA